MNEFLALALKLHGLGFSLIPLVAEGDWSKRPAVPWKKYQTERATASTIRYWFAAGRCRPGIVCGVLSNLTVIDCDDAAAVASAVAAGLSSPVFQATKRGRHFVFRHNGERNTVRVGGVKKMDRRGEGGYIVAYPDAMCWTHDALSAAPYLPEEGAI